MTFRRVTEPGWGEVTVFTCDQCGEEAFITDPDPTPGYGPIADVEACVVAIVGDPPRCAECRLRSAVP